MGKKQRASGKKRGKWYFFR